MSCKHQQRPASALLLLGLLIACDERAGAGSPPPRSTADLAGEGSADGGAPRGSLPSPEQGVDQGARDTGARPRTPDMLPALPPQPWSVEEDGPFQTGHRSLTVRYQPEGLDAPRALTLHLWYPTHDQEGETTRYLDAFPRSDIFHGASLAPPVDPSRGYPVHVHSHGNHMYAGHAPRLMKRFASHGWLVAAPDHHGNTLRDMGRPRESSMFWLRAADISASLDALEALPEEDPLAGLFSLERVMVSGHSFGGYTAFGLAGAPFALEEIEARCADGRGPGDDGRCSDADLAAFARGSRDPRVSAALLLAGGASDLYALSEPLPVEIPLFLMGGSEDQSHTEGLEEIWARLPEEQRHRFLLIEGACHGSFNVGICGTIDTEEAHQIIIGYSLAFATATLYEGRGEALPSQLAELLSGGRSLSPLAQLRLR